MAEYDAIVMPLQEWGKDGKAKVWIMGDLNFNTVLTLENRKTEDKTNTITRSDYAPGLIRINKDHLPTGDTIQLKVKLTSDESIEHHDWPQGGVMFV